MEGRTEVEVLADDLHYTDSKGVHSSHVKGEKFWMEDAHVAQPLEAGSISKVAKSGPAPMKPSPAKATV